MRILRDLCSCNIGEIYKTTSVGVVWQTTATTVESLAVFVSSTLSVM